MGKLTYILLFSPVFFHPQAKIKPVFGIAVNNGFEQIVSKDRAIEAKNIRSLGIYLSAGLQKIIDSTYVIYLGLRFGTENCNFQMKQNGIPLQNVYYFTGETFTLMFAPGLVINKRQKLFLTTGLARFYPFTGGGTEIRRNGKVYIYGQDLTPAIIDARLGLKWQVKPFLRGNFHFELGTEISFIEHRGNVEVASGYNNLAGKFYSLNYNTSFFYFGVQF